MALCRRCNAEIVWVRTPKGKMMCMDKQYFPYRANLKGADMLVDNFGRTIRCDLYPENVVPEGEIPTGMARKPHWATCPYAEEFRKARKEAAD